MSVKSPHGKDRLNNELNRQIGLVGQQRSNSVSRDQQGPISYLPHKSHTTLFTTTDYPSQNQVLPMSHRKYKSPITENRADIRSKIDDNNWEAVSMVLDLFEVSRNLSQYPDLSPIDFCKHIESLDRSKFIFNQFDQSALESIAPKDRTQFLKYYHVACITGTARELNMLDILQKYRLAAFLHPAKAGERSSMINHPRLEPLLPPIRSAYPFFNNNFMGAIQTRLDDILSGAFILPHSSDSLRIESATNPKSHLERIKKAQDLLTTRKLLTETRIAIEKYLDIMILNKEPSLAEDVSDMCSPIVFLWLMSIGNFDEMIDALLKGKPLLTKVPLANGQYGYEIGEKRKGVHVACLEDVNE